MLSAMSKRFGFKRNLHHVLMGAGSVLHPLFISRPSDPALHDALALQEAFAVVGQDMWDAVALFEEESNLSSRSAQIQQAEPNADDSSRQT
jgi:hypothetical protein